ncbi:MAG: hypothetical protein AB7U75_05665 [Hyphomicrobiaceae bacterium]|nr:hypothetical protein [Hyphomicrobiaceae bacterium]
MHYLRTSVCAAALASALGAANASAHVMPWRAGDSRVKGVGHCAKGPCTKLVDWSSSKPHHHHGKIIVIGWSHDPHKCPSAVYR